MSNFQGVHGMFKTALIQPKNTDMIIMFGSQHYEATERLQMY